MSRYIKRFFRLITKINHSPDPTWRFSYIGVAFLSICILTATTLIATEDNKNYSKSKTTFESWTHNIEKLGKIFKSDQPIEDLVIKLQFGLDYSKELPKIKTSILSIKKVITKLNKENNHHNGKYFNEAKNIIQLFNKDIQKIKNLSDSLSIKNSVHTDRLHLARELKLELYYLRNLVKKYNNVKIKECLVELDEQVKKNNLFNNRRLWVLALFIFLICCMLLQNYGSHQHLNKEITARKKQEELLAKTAEHAKHLAKIAQESNEIKSSFLANISHEIRTPMNGIIGMTKLLQATPLEVEQKDYLNTISYSANILLNIINDLLDISKIESGKIVIENIEFNLRHLIEEVLILMAPLVYQKQLFIYYFIFPECPEILTGDPVRLRQILINLVGNAVKFTSSGGITLEVTPLNSSQDNILLKLTIKDTGIGIEKEKQNLIFERFIQADNSTTRKYGGTGLGLSICKQLAELMGGTIQIESEINQGSQFILSLPFSNSHISQEIREPLHEELFLISEASHKYAKPLIEKCGCTVNELKGNDPDLQNKISSLSPDSIIVFCDENITGDFNNVVQLAKNKGLYSLWITYENSSLDFNKVPDKNRKIIHWPLRLEPLYYALKKIKNNEPDPTAKLNKIDQKINLNKKILLAEDNSINQKVAKKVLENWNCEVWVAENGQIACELTDHQHFDLILMDCQMPVMDGFKSTRSIREKEKTGSARIPIIAMTANARTEDKDHCLEAGMDEYIAKPFDHNELYHLILKLSPVNTEQKIEEPLGIKVINLEKLKKNFDHNMDFILEILTEYQKSTEESIKNLQTYYYQKEWEPMLRLVHSLKGSSQTVGAQEIAEIFVDLENRLKENQKEELEKIILNIFHVFDKVKHLINQIYNKDKTNDENYQEREII